MIQLKKIAKFYNVKRSGNKPELTKIYNSLLLKSKTTYIQKIYRKCLTKIFYIYMDHVLNIHLLMIQILEL